MNLRPFKEKGQTPLEDEVVEVPNDKE